MLVTALRPNFAEQESTSSRDDSHCETVAEELNDPSRLRRLYAARHAASCSPTGSAALIGDALISILLGDDPEVQRAALESLGPHLHPGHLTALVRYGSALNVSGVPYRLEPVETLADMPPAYFQQKALVYEYIHRILSALHPDQQGRNRIHSADFANFLKQGLMESRSARFVVFEEADRAACSILDSLALRGEPPGYLIDFVEKETQNPLLLSCGLFALSRYDLKQEPLFERVESLAQKALKGSEMEYEAAAHWYGRRPELDSLSRLLAYRRDLLPFSRPEISEMARRMEGNQGRIRARTPLYSYPYASGPVLRILSDGEAVNVLRRSPGFDSSRPGDGYTYLVQTADGLTGWVNSSHLQTESKKN